MKQAVMSLMLGVALLASLPGVSQAQGKGKGKAAWTLLGEANVDGTVDHDLITVGRVEGTFHAIQFRVERGPINFERVVVHYQNGEDDKLPLRNEIRAGQQSRVLDLKGGDRVIRGVEIWYSRAKIRGAKPRVVLYGRR